MCVESRALRIVGYTHTHALTRLCKRRRTRAAKNSYSSRSVSVPYAQSAFHRPPTRAAARALHSPLLFGARAKRASPRPLAQLCANTHMLTYACTHMHTHAYASHPSGRLQPKTQHAARRPAGFGLAGMARAHKQLAQTTHTHTHMVKGG